MTENKYYTPSIEEFHVGFEYEIDINHAYPDNGIKWVKCVLTDDGNCQCVDAVYSTLPDVQYGIEKNHIRVKYLDKQDIEECGWKYNEKGSMYNFDKRWNFDLGKFWLMFDVEKNRTLIGEIIADDIMFAGTIKNKSELKRIMKMIGI